MHKSYISSCTFLRPEEHQYIEMEAQAKKDKSNESKDPSKLGQRLFSMRASGITSLSIALGSKFGLFDLMAKFDEPKTSTEIADAGDLKER